MSAAPLIQPVNWLTPEQRRAPHGPLLDVIADARDVAGGAAEVLALLCRQDLDIEGDHGQLPPAFVSAPTRAELVRMSATSLRLLVARLGNELLNDAQRLAAGRQVSCVAAHGAELARLIPKAPCAGQMLTAEEAADLARLRDVLMGKAVQQ